MQSLPIRCRGATLPSPVAPDVSWSLPGVCCPSRGNTALCLFSADPPADSSPQKNLDFQYGPNFLFMMAPKESGYIFFQAGHFLTFILSESFKLKARSILILSTSIPPRILLFPHFSRDISALGSPMQRAPDSVVRAGERTGKAFCSMSFDLVYRGSDSFTVQKKLPSTYNMVVRCDISTLWKSGAPGRKFTCPSSLFRVLLCAASTRSAFALHPHRAPSPSPSGSP